MLARRPLGGSVQEPAAGGSRRLRKARKSLRHLQTETPNNEKSFSANDKIIPDLHKNPLADILRDADFEAQVKPVIETLQALGLKEKTMSVLANKKPKALLIRPENDKNTIRH